MKLEITEKELEEVLILLDYIRHAKPLITRTIDMDIVESLFVKMIYLSVVKEGRTK